MSRKAGVTFRYVEKVEPYEDALRMAGLEPVRISPEAPRVLDGLDGLVLTGGTDIDPMLYGQPRRPETGEPDTDRDQMESQLLREALDAGVPVLAICRGMQLFNVAQGGTLVQHLENVDVHRVRPPTPVDQPAHGIEVEPGTRLASILGPEPHRVNSRHHQAVARVGRRLIVSARAEDGVVEALEHPDSRFAVAVQWHPEDCCRTSDKDRKLFEAFSAALQQRR